MELAADEDDQEALGDDEDVPAALRESVSTPGTAASGTRGGGGGGGRRKSQDKPSEEVGSLEMHWEIVTWSTSKIQKKIVLWKSLFDSLRSFMSSSHRSQSGT